MIGKIHGFICETGSALKQEEILSYMKDLPILEERLPGDVLHKILFIWMFRSANSTGYHLGPEDSYK